MRNATVALLPAVVITSMFAMSHVANASPTSPFTTSATPVPGLMITKVPDATPVVAGNQIGFTITLTHSGVGADYVTLTDTMIFTSGFSWSIASQSTKWGGTCSMSTGSPQVLTCGPESFDNDDTATVDVVSPTSLPNCAAAINPIPNTASYSGMDVTGGPVTGSSTASVQVNCPPGVLTMTKTADDTTVSAGDEIGFTITAKNTGGTAIGPVDIYDAPPSTTGLDWSIDSDPSSYCMLGSSPMCVIPTLAAGASYSVHMTSPTTSDTCGTVSNTADGVQVDDEVIDRSVEATPDQVEIPATATVNVQCPDLRITKTPDLYRGVGGKKMSWTITVENHGPGTAHDVVMADHLDFGGPYSVDDTTHCYFNYSPDVLVCEFGDMAPGASFTVHLTAVLSSLSDCGEIRNVAAVEATNESLVFSSPAITTVKCPNVSVVKTADYGSLGHPSRGFDIVVSSSGGTLKNVKLTDPLDSSAKWSIVGGNGKSKCKIAKGSLTCSFGAMKAGKSFTVHIKAVQKLCSTITNTATVSASNEPSFESGDNTSTAMVGCVV